MPAFLVLPRLLALFALPMMTSVAARGTVLLGLQATAPLCAPTPSSGDLPAVSEGPVHVLDSADVPGVLSPLVDTLLSTPTFLCFCTTCGGSQVVSLKLSELDLLVVVPAADVFAPIDLTNKGARSTFA